LLYLHHLLGIIGWESALARLAESFDVIAPYAPGWGPSKDQLPSVEGGPLDLALNNVDLLDALGVESAHVVGISIGAWMAAELAAIFPDRVRKLVLFNPIGLWLEDAQGEDPFAQHPMAPSAGLFSDPALRQSLVIGDGDQLERLISEMLDLRASAKFLWPIPDTGIARRLGRIKAPTLIVTSEKDRVIPAEHGPAWQKGIAGSRLATLAGAGHLAELEQPDAFAECTRGFIADGGVPAPAR
jgi:pimeloyl-ACP methyl ester carboxylesterase